MAGGLEYLLARALNSGAEAICESSWRPATDIYQTADGWLLKV